eukprot:362781-Chlamydomonas_euryale.AAC.3
MFAPKGRDGGMMTQEVRAHARVCVGEVAGFGISALAGAWSEGGGMMWRGRGGGRGTASTTVSMALPCQRRLPNFPSTTLPGRQPLLAHL